MDALSEVRLRPLTVEDIPFGMRLKDEAGWNQVPADWARFLALEPEGCCVAELAGRAVGTVANFVFGPVGWIAMLLVDRPYRQRGIGQRLMQAAIAWLEDREVASIRLDATPLGRPLYETLGFRAQFMLARFAGQPNGTAGRAPVQAGKLEPYTDDQCAAVRELDRNVVGTDRGKLIERLTAEHPEMVRVLYVRGRLEGYVAARPGSHAAQIGPCVARSREAGQVLLADALTRLAGRDVYVDIPLDPPLAERLVAAAGLRCQRHLTRMARGRQVCEQVAGLWASSGPEKG